MRFHLVPIGGTAMVPLAALLAEAGHAVTGSDLDLYPPMSTLLASLRIPVSKGFASEHVPSDCEAVIVGNAALRDNAEAAEAARRKLPVLSLPQAVRRYLLPGKTSVVITGTHGKTTTSALTAFLLFDAGRDPGFLVGGEMKNFGRGHRSGRGSAFVLEGDEYNAAFFDRGPKFLHYEPKHLLVGNIEYDHADLYPDLPSVVQAFRQVVRLTPEDGEVVVNADDGRALEVAGEASAPVVRYSMADPTADYAARDISSGPERTEFTLVEGGLPAGRLVFRLWGPHNVANVLAATALCRGLGLTTSEIATGLARFEGVRRRLEVRGETRGITIVDDFAHHPTAVAATLSAARTRWPGRRIWAVFEPRSNTAGRKMFEEDYARAFTGADAAVIAPIFHVKRLPPEARIDREALVRRLESSGRRAFAPETLDAIPEVVRREARGGDVVILMSSGSFGGLPATILDLL